MSQQGQCSSLRKRRYTSDSALATTGGKSQGRTNATREKNIKKQKYPATIFPDRARIVTTDVGAQCEKLQKRGMKARALSKSSREYVVSGETPYISLLPFRPPLRVILRARQSGPAAGSGFPSAAAAAARSRQVNERKEEHKRSRRQAVDSSDVHAHAQMTRTENLTQGPQQDGLVGSVGIALHLANVKAQRDG
ncbi:hypothetical protein MRX96_046805 [Rhipicephalus microplus]